VAIRPAGVSVRAARAARWRQPSVASPRPSVEIIDAVPARVPAKIKAPARRRIGPPHAAQAGRRFLPIAAVSALALAAILLGRAEIVRALPEAASLFRAVGLPVNLRGLAFADLAMRVETEDGASALVVTGRIESDSPVTVMVPALRMTVRDASGAELYAWTMRPDAAALRAGESLPFHARLVSPPPGGYDVLVRFLQPSDG
jgi:hypothetical protein